MRRASDAQASLPHRRIQHRIPLVSLEVLELHLHRGEIVQGGERHGGNWARRRTKEAKKRGTAEEAEQALAGGGRP